MQIRPEFLAWHAELTAWRRDLHAHPELGFAEHRTAGIVAERLREFGLEVTTGLAGTGVVGTLRGRGTSTRAIALRADMDALPMQEENQFAHASVHAGCMHGCGHDGHTTMLLAAARYLAAQRNFDGQVHFVFQPAEERDGGGARMVREGLFERFPCEAVFGVHNWPALPLGKAGVRAGPMMAAADSFTIAVSGRGSHAAMPHQGVDPVLAAAHVVTALQSLVSRSVDPLESAVVSVTIIQGGTAFNVIPETVTLNGTARCFAPRVRDQLESGITRIATATAAAFGATASVQYQRRYPPVINSAQEVGWAVSAAAATLGAANVDGNSPPTMGAEDFGFMLEAKPGAYLFLGQSGGPDSCMVHNPRYDFNDELLPIGASYWVNLAESLLR